MILVDHQIKKYVNEGKIKIENFDEECIQPASYDMKVGDEIFLSTKKEVINLSQNGGYFTIDPGAMAKIYTHEYIELPKNILGRPGIKSGIARKGLFPSIGIQADPGFKGCLFINMLNLSPLPISMDYLDTFLSIEFNELESPPEKRYDGPYQGKRKLSAEDIQPLLAYEGLNLAQIHKGFSKLTKNIEVVASLSQKFESFIASHERQMEKTMKHNNNLIKEIKKLVQHISSQPKDTTLMLRNIDRKQATKEIKNLFKEDETLYYSDIAEQLRLDLELVVDICNDLEEKGIIGMLDK